MTLRLSACKREHGRAAVLHRQVVDRDGLGQRLVRHHPDLFEHGRLGFDTDTGFRQAGRLSADTQAGRFDVHDAVLQARHRRRRRRPESVW